MTLLHAHYKAFLCLLLIMIVFGIVLTIPIVAPSSPLNVSASGKWSIVAMLVAALSVLAYYFEFDSFAQSAKEIALVSMMGTLSAILRVPFAPIPSVQPSTFLIICTGYVFGPLAGFMIGATTPIISNFFLGQGPYTLFQIFAWGFIGLGAGYLGRLELGGRWLLVVLLLYGILSAYLFGAIMNLWDWVTYAYPLTWSTYVARITLSLWFDTFHAIGNVLFLMFFGTKTIVILQRFRKRFSVFYVPSGAIEKVVTDSQDITNHR
ncbi:MAG: ECF transporter S component [Chloroflexota bacterium]|nr:ECF transporter S component [Chloroflexota bacterium]